MAPSSDDRTVESPARWITWIMLAVAGWGAVLALGAWHLNNDPRRPLIVFGCVLAFLGFWLVMLALRSARARRR